MNVSDIDVEGIKSRLMDFLRGRPEFTDYNFEGSAINYMLDILSYNTFYNAVHSNLAFSEAFLDSAETRSAVVSRAKSLGYIPRSKTAAKATVNVTFSVTGNPSQYIVPKNTKFVSSDGVKTFTFITTQDEIFTNIDDTFSKTIDIVQGFFTTYEYVINVSNPLERYIIPDTSVDMDYLTVRFKNNTSDTEWQLVTDFKDVSFLELLPSSLIYFTSETYDSFYEVYFGDDVISYGLKNDNVISFEYLITEGAASNNLQTFTISSPLPNVDNIVVNTVSRSSGGSDRDSVDRIKFNAPHTFQAQNRAVTEDDYRAIVLQNFGSVADISVWGGDKNDPPYFGKVFVAIKQRGGDYTTSSKKEEIKHLLENDYALRPIKIEILDPSFTYVYVNTVITYNARSVTQSDISGLSNGVENSINNFFENTVEKFANPLYYSKLVKAIDNTSPYIVSSITNLELEKEVAIIKKRNNKYVFDFSNSIQSNTITSNSFTIDGVIWSLVDVPSENNTGNIAVVRTNTQGQQIFLNRVVGTVDYQTGVVTLSDIRIDSIVGDTFDNLLRIKVVPGSNTLFRDTNVYNNHRDQIITLKSINLQMLPDNTA